MIRYCVCVCGGGGGGGGEVELIMTIFGQAVDYFQQALELSPQTVTYKELGRVYLLTESLENALGVYQKAVK